MERPSPVPSPAGLVVKNGLNSFSFTSGVIPVPLSRILISTLSTRCESACKKDPLFVVIGIQTGPRHRGPISASVVFGSRGWDAGRGDDCKDTPGVFQAGQAD